MSTLRELTRLKYTERGEAKNLHIIIEASHKWKDIASLICDDVNTIQVLEQEYRGYPSDCLRQILVDNFIRKRPEDYAQNWKGLIDLLDDVGLESLAEKVKHALSLESVGQLSQHHRVSIHLHVLVLHVS